MERIVKNGAVYVGGNKYRHPLLRRINGCVVGVAFRQSSDEVIDVFSPDGFYCSAVCEGKNTTSPMKPAEKGRIEREFGRYMRQSARYPMKDEFPPIPENYRCRSGLRSDRELRREVRRTVRRYHQLRLATAGIGNLKQRMVITSALRGLKNSLNELTWLLREESERGEF